VNEVLIAFIKTLTKELKWQKLPFPLKIHINNSKYINNHWVCTILKELYRDMTPGVGKTISTVFFLGFCVRDETLYCFCLSKLALFFLSFLLSLFFLQRT